MGLEGSGASRRPGSIVRVLRTERWVRPTERAGSEGSFICRCLGQRKPYNRPDGRGNAPLLVAGATTFPPAGGLYSSLCVSFILPPLAGEVRRSRKGGGERSEPISRMVFMLYGTESKSRNASCVPFRGRGPRSGEGVDEGKNDYDTRCGRDRRKAAL